MTMRVLTLGEKHNETTSRVWYIRNDSINHCVHSVHMGLFHKTDTFVIR